MWLVVRKGERISPLFLLIKIRKFANPSRIWINYGLSLKKFSFQIQSKSQYKNNNKMNKTIMKWVVTKIIKDLTMLIAMWLQA